MKKILVHISLISLEKETSSPVIYDKHLVYLEGNRDSFMEKLVAESSVVNEVIMNDLDGNPYTLGHSRVAHTVTKVLDLVDMKKHRGTVESDVDLSNNYRLVVDIEYPVEAPRPIKRFFRTIMEYVK